VDPSPWQQLRDVFLVEHRNEIDGLALKCEREAKDRDEVRCPAAAFQLADARLRETAPLCELYLREPLPLTQVAQMFAEYLTNGPLHRHSRPFALTNARHEYTILLVAQERIFMLDSNLTERIRTIFLHEAPSVSIPDATVLLGWSRSEMRRAIASGDIETTTTCSGKAVQIEEVVVKAMVLWPLETIEEALGKDAALVLPPALRRRKLVAYLPGYQLQMLTYLAAEQQTTIGHILAHELDDLATDHLEELSARIDGFAEAFDWPRAETAEQPS
jgi:hypothetical protein